MACQPVAAQVAIFAAFDHNTGCLVSFSRWHLARRLFLLKLGAEARAEQLATEKERIDYERRFALRELERRGSASSAASASTAAAAAYASTTAAQPSPSVAGGVTRVGPLGG